MRMRAVAATAGGAIVVAGLATFASVAPVAAAGPSLKVKPTTNLSNGSTISVSGKGFTPGDHVYVVECLVGSTGGSGCNLQNLVGPETISSKGLLKKVHFTVHTGAIGSGSCGTSSTNASGCDVSVGNPSGADSATVTITFKT